MDCRLTVAQTNPALGNVGRNLEEHVAAIEAAVAAGSQLIVFPELSLTGYFLKDLVPDVALPLDSPEVTRLRELSRHVDIAVGLVEVTSDYLFYNTSLYLSGGEIRHRHRKVYLPTYGLFDEQRYLASGDRFRAFDSRFGRMGLLICEDMWHLSAPYLLAMDGATTILCLSSSPGRGVGQAEELGSATAWQRLNATVATFLTCRVLYCNRVGYEDGVNFWGGSEIIAPDGTVQARGKLFAEDAVIAAIDDVILRRERITSPLLRDESIGITRAELTRIDRERGL